MIYFHRRLAIVCLVISFLCGCQTTDRVKYNTIAAVMIAVDNSMIAYGEAVELELVTPELQTAVKINFERYKMMEKIALESAQFNTQKSSPRKLVNSATDLTVLLTQILSPE
tara:strand:+ start:1620 stop:1955 length:336 start_codon:yes stop_codon:yes gene_type:complete